jgi:hypothetical protein
MWRQGAVLTDKGHSPYSGHRLRRHVTHHNCVKCTFRAALFQDGACERRRRNCVCDPGWATFARSSSHRAELCSGKWKECSPTRSAPAQKNAVSRKAGVLRPCANNQITKRRPRAPYLGRGSCRCRARQLIVLRYQHSHRILLIVRRRQSDTVKTTTYRAERSLFEIMLFQARIVLIELCSSTVSLFRGFLFFLQSKVL